MGPQQDDRNTDPGAGRADATATARGGPATASQGPSAAYRRRQMRRIAVFVTLPGLLLGSASIAAAYGTGLLRHSAEAPTCTPTVVTAPDRDSFTLNVVNSNETAGQGADVARQLEQRGFAIGVVTNAPEDVYIKKSAIVYYGKGGLDNALLVAKQVPGSTLWEDGRDSANVDLFIGYGYTSLVTAPPPTPPKPSEITVNVYNTTYRDGLATTVGATLRSRGFRLGEVGNDPAKAFLPKSVAVLRYGPDGELAAERLQEQLPDVKMARDDRPGAELDLVLGNGFTRLVRTKELPAPAPTLPLPAETVERPCE